MRFEINDIRRNTNSFTIRVEGTARWSKTDAVLAADAMTDRLLVKNELYGQSLSVSSQQICVHTVIAARPPICKMLSYTIQTTAAASNLLHLIADTLEYA